MASDRQSMRNRENFYIAFIFCHNFVRMIKFRKEIFFSETKTKFLSAKVTKFARFYKQKLWQEKCVMHVGVYWGIMDRKLTNQSTRTIVAI